MKKPVTIRFAIIILGLHGLLVNACNCSTPLTEEELEALETSMTKIGEEWGGNMVYTHPDNPFDQEIPADYEVHENSAAMIDLIKSATGPEFTNTRLSTGDFSIPVYLADDDSPVHDIEFNLYGHPPDKTHMTDVPYIVGSKPAAGSDKHYAIIQEDSGCVYEFWLYDYNTAGGGNAHPIDENGIYEDGRSAVAAGWSALQGLIWPKELKEFHIPHALSFSVPVTDANGYVSPATKNDGALSDNEFAIPEGTLVRIKPEFDIDSISDIGPIEKAVYQAIQTYGMYCGDTNGAGLAIRTLSPQAVFAEAFPEEFVTNTNSGNYDLKNFPFDALEVLKNGPLTPSESRSYVDHGCATWR
jgi:hypothetical protein